MHDLGFIHRDLNDSNILFNQYGNKLKLIDFGCIGKEHSDTHIGKSYFMAPEIANEPSNFCIWEKSADIYVLGILLFKLLFGIPLDSRLLQSQSKISKE